MGADPLWRHHLLDDKVVRRKRMNERDNTMSGKRYGSHAQHEFQLYGEFGAIELQRREWTRMALKQAQVYQAIRTAGLGHGPESGARRRTTAIIGRAFVRFGMRLQGQGRLPVANAAQ